MNRYGIADVGSNTVVLIVYEVNADQLKQLKYISTPVHLINYVKDGQMSHEGIENALAVLKQYAAILDDMNISYRFADITEPCRIHNAEELIEALEQSGFEIHPLTGEQEALYDFEGAKFSYPDVHEGIAFDVGGGSTELISFKDDKAVEAMSFHLGCVRLAHLPLDTQECRKEILKARSGYPSLDTDAKTIIGIGGTARALGLVCEKAYGNRHHIRVDDLKDAFVRIRDKEPVMTQIVSQTVEPSRIPVLLPGMHMILEICDVFNTEEIMISDTGIREGFLMACIAHL